MNFDEIEDSSDLSTALLLLDLELRDRGLALDPPSTAPGLDGDQLRSWEEANADRIRLSDDVRTLWRWRAGSTSPWLRFDLLTPDQALAQTEEQRTLNSEGYRFEQNWVVVGDADGYLLVVDCSIDVAPSAVYSVEPEHEIQWPTLGALAYLFRFWAFCFAEGLYQPDPGGPGARPGIELITERIEFLRPSPYRSFL